MKLIAGLGNPGNQYAENRHNVGFMFAEFLVKKIATQKQLENSAKFTAKTIETYYNDEKLIVAEPQTFMNMSGVAISRLATFYKIAKDNIIIAHDELDIPIGKFKIQMATGPKLHGGLGSIEQLLGTKDFWRIRIGVENRGTDNRMPGEAYVLQNFTSEEKATVTQTFEKIFQHLQLQKFI